MTEFIKSKIRINPWIFQQYWNRVRVRKRVGFYSPVFLFDNTLLCANTLWNYSENENQYKEISFFIHSYSLIHDDLPSLDNDDFRRGKPSLHRAFGEAIALLAGDALLTLAFQVVAEASFSPSRLAIKVEIVRRLSQAAGVSGMIGGQIQDLQLTDEVRDEARFLAMVGKKTGQLITFSGMTGGLLGEASERERRALFNFGQNLGLAFQLRDDLADLNQDEQARQQAKNSPNYALVFGQAKTRQEVNSYVDKAVGALKEGGINSPELIYLSEKLRVEKEDVR